MLQEDRLLKIVTYINENKFAALEELSSLTGVSIGTVRRDLATLEGRGELLSVRGGAMALQDDRTRQGFDIRKSVHEAEKRELSQLIGRVVRDGQAVAINGGTTNIEVAKYLTSHYKHLMIGTNCLHLLEIFKQAEGFNVVMFGGVVNGGEMTTSGRSCEQQIRSYNFDVCLLAVNAVSDAKGITDFRSKEATVMKAFIESAKVNAVVADSSKFDRIAYLNICDLEQIQYILTDRGLTQEQKERYERRGVEVLTPSDGDKHYAG